MLFHPDDQLFPANKLLVLIATMAEEEISAHRILHGTALKLDELHNPKTRISLTQFLQACRNALKLSNNPRLALELGASFHVTTFGMYGYALLSHPNIRGFIEFALKYLRLALPTISIVFLEEREQAIWRVEPIVSDGLESPLYRFVVENEIAIAVTLFRNIVDTSFVPKEIRLSYSDSGQREAYETFFGCPIRFNCGANEIVFNRSWLSARPRQGDALSFDIVRRLCDDLLDEMEMAAGLAGRLRRFVIENLGQTLSIEAACKYLSLSPRTLRRKLIKENTSFQTILDDTRRYLARKYLLETVLPIDEVANRLGYNEPANFRHAFRRWTGTTPHEFRKHRNDAIET
jgi:AraC-like DNA-binding protein